MSAPAPAPAAAVLADADPARLLPKTDPGHPPPFVPDVPPGPNEMEAERSPWAGVAADDRAGGAKPLDDCTSSIAGFEVGGSGPVVVGGDKADVLTKDEVPYECCDIMLPERESAFGCSSSGVVAGDVGDGVASRRACAATAASCRL